MLRTILSLFTAVLLSITTLHAQTAPDDIVWVQLEAQPSLSEASSRIRGYGARMQDVNGFSLGGGWYAVALGPYRREDAENVLRVYRSEGLIPVDAYLASSRDYRSQFWPVGVNNLSNPQIATTTDADNQSAVVIVETPAEPEQTAPTPQAPDETVREARASESAMTRTERMSLQGWLQWGGYYNSAIDGAFGRGTRGSMSAWQADNGFDVTGVMTTLQRATLKQQYFAVLDGMGLQQITDLDAGIELQVPTGVVAKSLTEYPFVQYDATGALDATVLLISQSGDQSTLFGLYDIMQTLEIVPLNGERTREKNSFTLTGENGKIVSHTEATLKDGIIKGFTLVWPAGDDERRSRILGEMKASFNPIDGVLDPAAGDNAAQNVDLLAGLQIRKPRQSRSGFFIDRAGHVVTTAQAVEQCAKITIEEDYAAEVSVVDAALGIAILTPTTQLAPVEVATLLEGAPRLQSEVAASGYSYEGALGAPTLTFGKLEDIKGLRGEQELTRLALTVQPGDSGGPVFDASGAVSGMLLPRDTGTQQLPMDVNFAVNSDAIRALLKQEGLQVATSAGGAAMAPEDLTKQAGAMTVLVSCW